MITCTECKLKCYFPGCNRTCELHPDRELALREEREKTEKEIQSRRRHDEAFERIQAHALQKSGGVHSHSIPEESKMRLRGTMTSE